VHGIPDSAVFLAQQRADSLTRQTRGQEQSSWASAHDEDVDEITHQSKTL
jgi:hypothetical protein